MSASPGKQMKKTELRKLNWSHPQWRSQSVDHLEHKLLNTETTTEPWFKTFLSARVSDTSLHSDLAQEDLDVLLRKETANPKQPKTVRASYLCFFHLHLRELSNFQSFKTDGFTVMQGKMVFKWMQFNPLRDI